MNTRTITIASRGSALALAQTNMIKACCQAAFPELAFEIQIIKTTGDKLQTAALAQEGQSLPKGLFTKELEVAMLEGRAHFAVHSLKDLPTELPPGLKLGAVGGQREDTRDVLIYRDSSFPKPGFRGFPPGLRLNELPASAVVATASTRRKAQLLTANAGLHTPDIRGNVPTRLQKLASQPQLDATLLACAGMRRLNYTITPSGQILGNNVPEGLLARILDLDEMLPCVGQGAIGIECRCDDPVIDAICARLNHLETFQSVTAERAFLAAMGGGCQSPVAAFAEVIGSDLHMRVLSFTHGPVRRAQGIRPVAQAVELGQALATQIKSTP